MEAGKEWPVLPGVDFKSYWQGAVLAHQSVDWRSPHPLTSSQLVLQQGVENKQSGDDWPLPGVGPAHHSRAHPGLSPESFTLLPIRTLQMPQIVNQVVYANLTWEN